MTTKYVMGIDNGGTLIKAAIYNLEGEVQALSQVSGQMLTPHMFWTERDMEEMWRANCTAIRQCLDSSNVAPSDIGALAVTGHGNGLYLVDENGNGTRNGIISTDLRAEKFSKEWSNRPDFNDVVRSRTGSDCWAGQPTAILGWLDEHEPEIFAHTRWVLMAKDYIRFKLTGVAHSESSDMTGIGLTSIETRELDPVVFNYYGLTHWMEKFPPQIGAVDVAGYVTAEAAELTGLSEGTPVSGGLMDIAAGALAAGLTAERELCVITGTWSINEILTSQPANDEEIFLTLTYPVEDKWLLLEGNSNGVSNLDWFIKNILRHTLSTFGHQELSDAEVFEICEQMILDFEPSIDDPIFLPYINGTEIIPDGKGTFIGLTLRHDIRHMVRAVYEGVIFSHIYHVKKLREVETITGNVRFTGGAANSEIWTQMFADGFDQAIDIVDANESGTLGSAMVSAVAIGAFKNTEEAVKHMGAKVRRTVEPSPEFADLFAKRYEQFTNHLQEFIRARQDA